MPQNNKEDCCRSLSSISVTALSGELAEAETDAFLSFLFRHIAYRPGVLHLRETAAVVRYLQTLAWKGVPAELINVQPRDVRYSWSDESEETLEGRRLLQRMAKVIWGYLLQSGDFSRCGKQKAKAFLQRHSQTYLVSMEVKRALAIIDELEVTPDVGQPFRPPHLKSATMSAQGQGNPRLQDDLSERIYTAYQALKQAQVKRIRPRIAEALNRAGVVSAGQRRSKLQGWDWREVHDRLKRYERRLKEKFRKEGGEKVAERVQQWREHLVYSWVLQFHMQQQLAANSLALDANEESSSGI